MTDGTDSAALDELPPGWAWATLTDVAVPGRASITDGPFGSNLKTEHYTERGPRVVRLQNIGDGTFLDEYAHISEERFQSLRKHEVLAGDLLVAMLGVELPRACVAPSSLGAAIVKADCARVRVDPHLASPAYVCNALNCDQSRRRTAAIVHGVGRPRLNLGELKAVRFPLAPRREQDRIVDAIDQHLSDIDAGVAALERVRANLKCYRASVLKTACEGRLVPTEAELARKEKRSYEPGYVLLERILKERRTRWEEAELKKVKGQRPRDERWKRRYEEPQGPVTSQLAKLPEGWCWTAVEQCLAEPACNGLSIKGSDEPPGVPALRLSAMTDRGFDYTDVRYLPIAWSEVNDLEVRESDFFVSRGNGTLGLVGRGTPAQPPPSQLIFPDTMIRVRMCEPLRRSRWHATLWSSSLVRGQIEKRAKTTAGIWKISQGDLASVALPLPPLSEQARIVAEVDRLLSISDETEQLVVAQLARAARLRQSVLKTAFEGKLVPQDPKDEPASLMLERLRGDAADTPPARSRRKPPRAAVKPAAE